MKLGELIAAEAGVSIESVMLLRHSLPEVNRLLKHGATIEDYTAIQRTGSKYDYRDPSKAPIEVVVVIVDDLVAGIYRVGDVQKRGTTYTLGGAAQRQLNIERGRAEVPALQYELTALPSVALGKSVSSWAGRQRTPVQRSNGSFFGEVEVDLAGDSPGRFKHGKKRTWELIVDAVSELGGSASRSEILNWILARVPTYLASNLSPDLSMLSVNSESRGQYSNNFKPRLTNTGHPVDKLYRRGFRAEAAYELYDHNRHGVWEIYLASSLSSGERPEVRLVNEAAIAIDFAAAESLAENSSAFDPNGVADARKKVLGAIVLRQGQPAFRQALLSAYAGRCAFTGCTLPQVLEAAHIRPYLGRDTNVVQNGLLLRADVHTLFDLGLLRVDSESLEIRVSGKLANSEYAQLDGKLLEIPSAAHHHPSREALAWHSSHSQAW